MAARASAGVDTDALHGASCTLAPANTSAPPAAKSSTSRLKNALRTAGEGWESPRPAVKAAIAISASPTHTGRAGRHTSSASSVTAKQTRAFLFLKAILLILFSQNLRL